jgi:hypothetical protein
LGTWSRILDEYGLRRLSSLLLRIRNVRRRSASRLFDQGIVDLSLILSSRFTFLNVRISWLKLRLLWLSLLLLMVLVLALNGILHTTVRFHDWDG